MSKFVFDPLYLDAISTEALNTTRFNYTMPCAESSKAPMKQLASEWENDQQALEKNYLPFQ